MIRWSSRAIGASDSVARSTARLLWMFFALLSLFVLAGGGFLLPRDAPADQGRRLGFAVVLGFACVCVAAAAASQVFKRGWVEHRVSRKAYVDGTALYVIGCLVSCTPAAWLLLGRGWVTVAAGAIPIFGLAVGFPTGRALLPRSGQGRADAAREPVTDGLS